DAGGHLVVHLGMTGQFFVTAAETPTENHTHVVFVLDDGRELRFRDIRRFGSLTYYADREALDAFFLASGLGQEPFDLERTSWHARLAATHRSLKAVLLDQRIVAGVGNIYADESLYVAKLHPGRLAHGLSLAESERLRKAVAKVLGEAINGRGSS